MMKKIPIRQINNQPKERSVTGSFTVRKVENVMNGKDLQHELHRHDFFFILALQKGKGKHEIDFTNYVVKDNTVFFLRPGQVHKLELKKGSTGYLVEFNNEFFQPSRKAGNLDYCQLGSNRFKKIFPALENLFEEYTAKEEGYNDIIKANLGIFFIELLRESGAGKEAPKTAPYAQERLDEFLELLDTQITEHKQVAYYTEHMNLSAYQLNEITKTTIGKTSSEIINGHIILEAKRYLLATANQVKEIADMLGYEDISYFIRFFKKHTGYTPDAFRNKSV